MRITIPVVVVFLLGLYYYINYSKTLVESFSNYSCPNLLVHKGNKIYLYNKNKAEVPGINPIKFNNLEEYVEYMDWLKSNNIKCPVLYLKKEYNTQNFEVYKIRPDIVEMNGGAQGIPPGKNLGKNSILTNKGDIDNVGFHSAYDPKDQDQGSNSALDKLFSSGEHKKKSDNPMDSNWGGTGYTQSKIDSGKYKGNEVDIRVP